VETCRLRDGDIMSVGKQNLIGLFFDMMLAMKGLPKQSYWVVTFHILCVARCPGTDYST